MCTGRSANSVIVDATDSTKYSVCGECSVVSTGTCPVGKKYDVQCKKCVTGAFPNCDDAGMKI